MALKIRKSQKIIVMMTKQHRQAIRSPPAIASTLKFSHICKDIPTKSSI